MYHRFVNRNSSATNVVTFGKFMTLGDFHITQEDGSWIGRTLHD